MNHISFEHLEQFILYDLSASPFASSFKQFICLIKNDDQMLLFPCGYSIKQIPNLHISFPARTCDRWCIMDFNIGIDLRKLAEDLRLSTASRTCKHNVLSSAIYMVPQKHRSGTLRVLLSVDTLVEILVNRRRCPKDIRRICLILCLIIILIIIRHVIPWFFL